LNRKIIVGSRGSKLAVIQAESIVAAIRRYHPEVEVDTSYIVTKGDRNRRVQLDHMADIGVFVKELEEALLDGRIDLAVHSLKDMPTDIPDKLVLAAAPERNDARDVLISRGKKLHELAPGARIGTGSLRRAIQVSACRPDLETRGIRGNVDTRIRKVNEGEFDGVVLAAAAMKRLGWEDLITEYLPVESFLSAVGQGALGIETRRDDPKVADIVATLDHQPTRLSVTAERAFLEALGGGCRAPIAALGTAKGKVLKLEGMVAGVRTKRILRRTAEGSNMAPEELGKSLAQELLEAGSGELIAEAEGK